MTDKDFKSILINLIMSHVLRENIQFSENKTKQKPRRTCDQQAL